ncbi:MAG TPA: hypothetical protein PKI61_03515 [bacterium]|nr:hypothetical protein [bacterium]HPT29581.1 hypothetical protein [bacterium]
MNSLPSPNVAVSFIILVDVAPSARSIGVGLCWAMAVIEIIITANIKNIFAFMIMCIYKVHTIV